MDENMSEQATRAKEQQKEMIMGSKVKLLAGCPESQPFWNDHNKTLECFVCNFTQKWNQSFVKTEDLNWMTKRIKRDDASIVISLCPSCISGEPWILHSKSTYTSISIVKGSKKESGPRVLTEIKSRANKDWLSAPVEPPTYRADWTTSDFIERPHDWAEQENKHFARKEKYAEEKLTYDAFCNRKISEVPMISFPTTGEMIKRTEEKRLNAQRAKFARRTQKRFQTPEFRMKLNSPLPKANRVTEESAEKENDENAKTQPNP
jgi:hypothetical protein